jgi:beta-galactosidase/beta-glucuronidase
MSIPRPEHPRPQFVRDSWMNLNGEWDFLFDFGNSGRERDLYDPEVFLRQQTRKITVPFCPESRLSGIGYTDWMAAVWYHRAFDLTEEQLGGRVILHFGAVDYHSVVYLNGRQAGEHTGGYSSFSFDVTDFVREGENRIVVYAEDDNRSGRQPVGKQCERYHSYACSYTRTTGIWQTVWLEFVPSEYIRYAKITPFPDDGRAVIDAETEGGPY